MVKQEEKFLKKLERIVKRNGYFLLVRYQR